MDLKISALHDSRFFALQLGDKLRQGTMQEPHTRELSDTKSHVSRLSYCFVSGHVISQFGPRADRSLRAVVHALFTQWSHLELDSFCRY